MSSQSKSHLGRVLALLPAMIAVLCMFGTLAAAQNQPAPKWELFGGYSFFHPGADVHGVLPLGLFPVSSRLEANPRGVGASITYNFNNWLGLTFDGSTHWGSGETGVSRRIDDTGFLNLSVGPKVTFRSNRFSPFLEVLVGDHRLMPDAFHDVDKLGFMFGGGLDINLSRHVALRLFRADFVVSSYRYGPAASTPATEIRGVRLQTGLNFMFGGGPPPVSPSAACSVQPSEVFAGEPVTATANGSNFNPKRTVKYNWNGTGVKVAGSDASTQIETTGLQPGSYGVTANLSDGSKNGFASCSAKFIVKEPRRVEPPANRPPVMSCSLERTPILPGERTKITATASDPDNDPLSFTWRASSGQIVGSGASVQFDATGLAPGRYTVTGRVDDGRGGAADCSVDVDVQSPPAPPQASKLNECFFRAGSPRVDNVCKRILDDVALKLKNEPKATVLIIGFADPKEPRAARLAQMRAQMAKKYLGEKGIDESRVVTRAGEGQKGAGKQNGRIDIIWVPEGATY